MHTINREPLGKGINSTNSIIFSAGRGVFGAVTAQINFNKIKSLADNPLDIPKEKSCWILPNNSPIRKRKRAEVALFGILWADIDNPPSEGIDAVVGALKPSTPYLAYTTKSATFEAQRCRVLIPLAHPVNCETWLLNQQNLNKVLEKAGIAADDCNLNPNQILFLPNRGAFYVHLHREGLFTPKETTNTTTTMSSQASHKEERVSKQSKKGGIIGAFKSAYSVSDILKQANYQQNPRNALQWRHPKSDSGSYSASIDPETGRVHSLSTLDPLYTGGGGVGAHDSFSCFTVLFCNGNQSLAVAKAAGEMLEVAHG